MTLVDIYKSLADESRLRLTHIISKGYFNVQELTSVLEVGQSTVSHHIKVLQAAGLVRQHKEGTWSYYSLANNDSPARVVAQNFLDLLEQSVNGEYGERFRKDSKLAADILEKRRKHSQRFFDQIAPEWKQVRGEALGPGAGEEDLYLQQLLSKITPSASLLDLGCGSGSLLDRVLPRNGTTIAVDYSQAMLEEARRELDARASQVDFRLGYLEHLPVGDASIDIAVACMVLHHLSMPGEALRDIFRVLRPGGSLFIVDLMKHENEFMRERYADTWLGFDPNEFKEWLAEAGFQDIHTDFLGEKKEVLFVSTSK